MNTLCKNLCKISIVLLTIKFVLATTACEEKKSELQIFNGLPQDFSSGAARHTVKLEVNGDPRMMLAPWICTGVLIEPLLVLTAAHCLDHSSSRINVVFGEGFGPHFETVRIRARRKIIHPQYSHNEGVGSNDIAMIKLSEYPPLSYVPAPIGSAGHLASGAEVLFAGYGLYHPNEPLDELLRAGIGVIDRLVHETGNSWNDRFPNTIIIDTSDSFLNQGGCFGDSGGPLFLKSEENGLELIGITSFVDHQCQESSVYTNILPYMAWIESIRLVPM